MSRISLCLPDSKSDLVALSCELAGDTRKMPSITWPLLPHSVCRNKASASGTPSASRAKPPMGCPKCHLPGFFLKNPPPLGLAAAELRPVKKCDSFTPSCACIDCGAICTSARGVATMGELAARGASPPPSGATGADAAAWAPLVDPDPDAAGFRLPSTCDRLPWASFDGAGVCDGSGRSSSSESSGILRIRVHARLTLCSSEKAYVFGVIAFVEYKKCSVSFVTGPRYACTDSRATKWVGRGRIKRMWRNCAGAGSHPVGIDEVPDARARRAARVAPIGLPQAIATPGDHLCGTAAECGVQGKLPRWGRFCLK